MELKDMKLPKGKATHDMTVAVESQGKGPRYPWGLQINLDNESLAMLGLDEMPEVGEKCMVYGVGKVTGATETERQGDEKRRSVEIQITRLAIESGDKALERGFARGPKKSKGY